jgi:hypothetical protein
MSAKKHASTNDCPDGQSRVPNTAVLAVYYDKNGHAISGKAEDLKGVKDRCITEAKNGTGSTCPPGYREVTVGGVKYCVRA